VPPPALSPPGQTSFASVLRGVLGQKKLGDGEGGGAT
jgi:hypothetical protein